MPRSHPNHDAAANDLVCWILTVSVWLTGHLGMSNIAIEMMSRKYFIVFTEEGKTIYYKAMAS